MKTATKNILLCSFITAILYTLLYQYIDRDVAIYMKSIVTPGLHQVSENLSLLAMPKFWTLISLLSLTLAILCYITKRFSILSFHLIYLSMSVLLAQFLGEIIKYSLGRARPLLFLQDHIYGFHFMAVDRLYHSTPSGHTLCIFAFAMAASILYKRSSLILFIFATVTGLSRIVLTEHYMSDVLFGAYIGIISAMLMQYLLRKNTYLLNHN